MNVIIASNVVIHADDVNDFADIHTAFIRNGPGDFPQCFSLVHDVDLGIFLGFHGFSQ